MCIETYIIKYNCLAVSYFFRKRLRVDSICKKIKQGKLRCFRYVKMRQVTTLIRVVKTLDVEERSRGRPKLT